MSEIVCRLGMPSSDQLRALRIWDAYFTPAHAYPGPDGISHMVDDMQRCQRAIEIGHFEKMCYFAHVGLGTTKDQDLEAKLRSNPALVLAPLERWPGKLIGMIQLNANRLNESLDAIERWLGDGPMRGVYFAGGGSAAVTCTHPNFDQLIERIAALNGLIMQHTWFKTAGKEGPGESTPSELAQVAQRYPAVKFICAHAGGEWERGLRAVREQDNILVETSGFDSTAGFMEMAIRELGAERIVFGSHLPSRSLGTELAKITAAEITFEVKKKILGQNLRDLLGARDE